MGVSACSFRAMQSGSAPIHVLAVEPWADDVPRGNSVAVTRIVGGLRRAGLGVTRISPSSHTVSAAIRAARSCGATVVHAFHALRSGPLAREVAVRLGLPLVVSFRGTDTGPALDHG